MPARASRAVADRRSFFAELKRRNVLRGAVPCAGTRAGRNRGIADPKLSDPWNALAFLARRQRQFVEARQAMDRALELAPDDATVNFYPAELLIDTGYTRPDIGRLGRSLAIDPLRSNALHWRAFEYLFAGDVDTAENLWTRAGKVGFAFATTGFAEVAKARGNHARARSLELAFLMGTPANTACLKAPRTSVQAYLAALFGGDAAAGARALAVVHECLAAKPRRVAAWTVLGLLHFGPAGRALQVIAQHPGSDDAGWFIYFWGPLGQVARATSGFPAFARKVGFAALWDRYGPPDGCGNSAKGDYVCQ